MLLSLQLFRRYKQHLANSAPNGSKCSELQGLLLCYPPSIYTGFTQPLHWRERKHFHSRQPGGPQTVAPEAFQCGVEGVPSATWRKPPETTWLVQAAAESTGPWDKLTFQERTGNPAKPVQMRVQRQITCTLKYASIGYDGKWWVKKKFRLQLGWKPLHPLVGKIKCKNRQMDTYVNGAVF